MVSAADMLGMMSDVTQILAALEHGDPNAAAQLLPLVYDELRQLAAHRLTQEKPGQTLQATALVHEAYLRLCGGDGTSQHWNGRSHFFGAAAEAMRRILIDNARRKKTDKHGGEHQRVELAEIDVIATDDSEQWLLLDDALTRLAVEDPVAAHVAKLRLFVSLPVEEIAETLGMARATAFRHWTYARAWLQAEMADDQSAQ
jgi:RNA polymerase sigma factor (TIGR02999 family)